MSLLISDANIVIDFEEGGILEVLFELPDDIGVPDLLFEDELKDQHQDLLDLGLRLVELEETTVERLTELTGKYRGVSRLDMAALAAAEQEACPLVTGDRRLRQAAESEGVEVHGTLWLAEALVQEERLTVVRLKCAYDAMKAAGRRLPWGDVDSQLSRLELGRTRR